MRASGTMRLLFVLAMQTVETGAVGSQQPTQTAAANADVYPAEAPAIVTAADGQLWRDTSWHDGGYHPDDDTFGKQEVYGNGTGRPDGGWNTTIVPSQMPAPIVQQIGIHHVTLSWKMPKENGAVLEGYRIMMKQGGDPWEFRHYANSETELAMEMDRLKAGTHYQFKVIPVFDHGRQGADSEVTAVNTKIGEPDAPTKPYVTDIQLRSMVLHWTAPRDNGGSITGYRITMQEDDVTSGGAAFFEKIANTRNSSTSAFINGLKPGGHVYQFRVNGINKEGMSLHSPSSLSYETLHTSAPEAPSSITGTAIDDSTIRLEWTPAPNNGDPVHGYRVEVQTEGSGPYIVLTKNTGLDDDGYKVENPLSYDVSDLEGGKSYKFSVQGINKNGPGKKGYSAMLKPKAGAPGEIEGRPSVGDVTDSSARLEWNAPWDGGAPILGYRILMRTAHTGGFAVKISNTTSSDTTTTVSGLTHGGVMYEFKVQGINQVGVGPKSKQTTAVQTLYSATTATAMAVKQAMEDFKAHNKIHTLWKLEMENERYNKKSATQKKIVKNAEELGAKAKTLASQMRMRLAIETDLAQKKLDMESKLGRKKVRLQIDVCNSKRKLLVAKYEKLMKEVKDKSLQKIDDARNIALKKIEKFKISATKKCDSQLKDQKTASDEQKTKMKAESTKTVTEMKDAAERAASSAASKLSRTQEEAKRKLASVRSELEQRLTKQSAELKAQIADLIEKMPKELPIDKELKSAKAQASIKSMESLKEVLQHSDADNKQEKTKALAEASKMVAEKTQQAKDAEASAAELKKAYEDSQTKQKEAQAYVDKLERQVKAAGVTDLGSSQTNALSSQPMWHGVVVDLELSEGGEVDPVSDEEQKDLLFKLEEAKQRLKTATAQVKLSATSFKLAQAKAQQLRVDADTMGNALKLQQQRIDIANTNATQAQEDAASAAMLQREIDKSKNKTNANAIEKAKDALIKNVTSGRPQFGMPCSEGELPTGEEFENLLPDAHDEFKKMLQTRKALGLSALCGSPQERAQFLSSCEMVANCRALGGNGSNTNRQNCNQQTMCSAGSTKANARPCKTCASLFVMNRWRKLNQRKLDKCDGTQDCKPTPLKWKLCTTDDVVRNPAICQQHGIGRDPAPEEDVSAGYTHCTSCHEGDALEIVHPDTQTGICRRFGPSNGGVNLNSMPQCHAPNNLVVLPTSQEQVCTKVFRPALIYNGMNGSDAFLHNHNKYAYVTCNVRKSVACTLGESERFPISAHPASYADECEDNKLLQRLDCKTEKQVDCANVCRVRLDGKLCLRNETCASAQSWTYQEATNVMLATDLLSAPLNLDLYDCDPSRCDPKFCYQAALC